LLFKCWFWFVFLQTEQIRRANQLWTNDSLFLRDKLLIPVEKGSQENDEGGMEADLSSNSGSVSNNHGGTTSTTTPLGENGSFKMQPHWSHPLCDSFESEDCIVSSPISVNLELSNGASSLDESVGGHSSSTWSSSGQNNSMVNTSCDQLGDSYVRTSSNNNGKGAIHNGGGAHNNQQLLKNSKHYSSMDYGPTYQSTSSDMFFTSSTAPGTPGSPSCSSSASPSRRRSVVDHSEKSAEEFLSRIDTAIASSKMQAMNKSEQDKPVWVTFDSDSESDHRNTSGTSISRQGRHLRYSLRKLEKAQEELFQL